MSVDSTPGASAAGTSSTNRSPVRFNVIATFSMRTEPHPRDQSLLARPERHRPERRPLGLVWISLVTMLFLGIGFAGFRRRDLAVA
jgi:hypothetical protein